MHVNIKCFTVIWFHQFVAHRKQQQQTLAVVIVISYELTLCYYCGYCLKIEKKEFLSVANK